VEERVIVSREPLNAETRLELQDGPITPTSRHYVRSHFAFPDPPAGISIGGAVRDARSVSLSELRALPGRTLTVTLECAGNGRSFLEPPAPGEQWGLGAVSTAEWTGVPLSSLLEPRGVFASVVEILFRGADAGTPPDTGARIAFERSLPIERALADDVLVAYAMNGADLPHEFGAPARLVVPGWYGMASVKWLAEIVAIEQPFRGFYQADRYVIGDEPLAAMRPRAVIVAPLRAVAAHTASVIRGYAWSGHGPVTRVEVSADGGAMWTDATLGPDHGPAAWREFRSTWTPKPGTHDLVARATDAAGETQSLRNVPNAQGYANNAAQPVRVDAR
jgi:DMSO/TMAO reductase YedYZ molybdopterin-dependent catalytic subunit